MLLNILNNNDNTDIQVLDKFLNSQLSNMLKDVDDDIKDILTDLGNNRETIIMEKIVSLLETINIDLDISKFLYLRPNYSPVILNKSKIQNAQMLSLLKKIELNYGKITKNKLKESMSTYNLVNFMFELPYNDVSDKYNKAGKAIPPVYRNFFYSILSQDYRRPYRETTNALLQDIIDCKTETQVKDFFSFMEKIYEFFLKNNSQYK